MHAKKTAGGIARELISAFVLLSGAIGAIGAIIAIFALGLSWWVLALLAIAYVAWALLRRVLHLEAKLRDAEAEKVALEKQIHDSAATRERLDVRVVLADRQPPLTTVSLAEGGLDEWVKKEAESFPPAHPPSAVGSPATRSSEPRISST